jgi:hypothetical protein
MRRAGGCGRVVVSRRVELVKSAGRAFVRRAGSYARRLVRASAEVKGRFSKMLSTGALLPVYLLAVHGSDC